MSKPYSGPWILRTVLFTAGHIEKYIRKAYSSDADCIVLDLEDAVPENMKEVARNMVGEWARHNSAHNRPVMVRINPLDSGLTLPDLEVVASAGINGFIYPKAYTADDIKTFAAQLAMKEEMLGLAEGYFDIIPIIETPRATLTALEIAMASPRVIGLLFGSEDYLTDMRGFHGPEGRSILCPRHLIAMAARAAGIVPIDTPFIQVHDDSGLKAHIIQASELGFEGMLVMSPRQIQIAQELYTPSAEQIAKAREMVRLAEEAASAERGIALSGDIFISPPTLKRQKNLLERYEAIAAFEGNLGLKP